jgi:hypothetical protein
MNLSKNLSLAEMTRSDLAKRSGIKNEPTAEHLNNMKKLAVNVFQPIRDHFNTPIHISSGYRSLALNKAIKGSLSSQHLLGQAIDIDMDNTGITNAQIFNWIKDNLSFDQLIWEFGTDKNPDWVHVSFKSNGKQRKQVLKATKKNGKTTYTIY